ncbi:hypothetical protein [Streptomyces sp. NRRL S-87]|uniref:hypothetical protein n=1 Tax=Streptomyces sp. NRRL S-87 TaxID=1463920 RepID=UPI00131D725A|nr:hypothetical protein [Streptomyces sp. NRRL S-87]
MGAFRGRKLSAIRRGAVLAAAGLALALAGAQGALGGDDATHLRLDVGWNGPKPVVHAAPGTVGDVTGDVGWNAAEDATGDVGWNGPNPGGRTNDVGWN